MALKKNPLTGLLEEDGLPGVDDPTAMPEVPTTFTTGAGGAAPGGVPAGSFVQVGPATKPLQEVETQQKIKSPESAKAEADLLAAQTATDQAAKGVAEIAGKEADLVKVATDDRVAQLKDQQNVEWEQEQSRRRFTDAAMEFDRNAIEQEKQAGLAVGKADQSYWEGRPVAKLFTKVLQVIGGTAHDASGQGGPSPVDRQLNEYMESHRKRLVSAFTATKEANQLLRTNRQAHEVEIEKRKIFANNQSLRSLDVIEEQMKASIAGLSKEKALAAEKLTTAELNEKRAALRQQNVEGYNKIQKITDNRYAAGAGGADGVKMTQGQAEGHGGLMDALQNADKVFESAMPKKEHLERRRDNLERLKAHEVNVGKGDEVLPALKRAAGWTPEDEWDGIPGDQKAAIENMNLAFDSVNKIITGAAQSDGEFARRSPTWTIQPGDTQADADRKLQHFVDFAKARKRIAGPLAPEIQQVADALEAKLNARKASAAAEEASLKKLKGIDQEIEAENKNHTAVTKGFDPENPSTWSLPQLQQAERKLRGTRDPRLPVLLKEIARKKATK